MLEQDELMKRATSSYVDDVYVNEDMLPVDEVRGRLESFNLSNKDHTKSRDGAVVLGLKVGVERARHTEVGAREISSGTPCYTDATYSILHVGN